MKVSSQDIEHELAIALQNLVDGLDHAGIDEFPSEDYVNAKEVLKKYYQAVS